MNNEIVQHILRNNKYNFQLFVIFIWLIPSFILSYINYIDAFMWWPLSEVAAAIHNGNLHITNFEQSSYTILLYSVASICNIQVIHLAIIPIGAFIVPICFYALTKRLLESKWFAILLCTYISYDFSIYPGYYSTFAYAWTDTLFLSFLLLYCSYLKNPDSKYLLLIIPVFLTTYFLHPTYTMWMILFAIFINICFIFGKHKLQQMTFGSAINLALFFIIFYLGFNKFFYNVYIKKLTLLSPDMISDEFITVIGSFLGINNNSQVGDYLAIAGPPNRLMGYATFARTFIILILFLLGSIFWLKRNHKNIFNKIDNEVVVILTLFFVGIAHTAGYAAYGHMSLRFITFVFPIITLMVLKKNNLQKIQLTICALTLVIIALLQTGSNINTIYQKPDKVINDVRSSSIWLMNKTQNSANILSDFHTSQVLYYYFANEGRSFNQIFYDSQIYGQLIEGKRMQNISYILINKNINGTPTTSWQVFKPLSEYSNEINNNNNIQKIYSDNKLSIFKTLEGI